MKAPLQNLRIITCFAVFSLTLLFGFALGAKSVNAQTSMSGGSYTLNGGVAVFEDDISGGGYTLNPLGDSTGESSSGGGYSLYPTPYSSSTTGGGNGGSGNSGSVSAGSWTGGYTYYLVSTSTLPAGPEYLDTSNIPPKTFDPNQPSAGVVWIDRGVGVDLDFDGIPDIYGPGSMNQATGTDIVGGENTVNSSETSSPLIKIYDNDLGGLKTSLAILFAICMLFGKVARNGTDYRISRMPVAILIDYFIIMHRSKEDERLDSVPVRDFAMENSINSLSSIDEKQSKIGILTLNDRVIAPGLTLICMVWSWPISWLLGLVFFGIFCIRLAIGTTIQK